MSYSAQPFPTNLVYTDADFRANFPYFANAVTYPESMLQMFFTLGTEFVSNVNIGLLNGANLQTALYLMTAHLTQLNTTIAANNGDAANVVTDAQIDKIRVAVKPPEAKTAFQGWLNQTAWGQQLRALLAVASVGGLYVGGNPERAGFRRVGGAFGGPWR